MSSQLTLLTIAFPRHQEPDWSAAAADIAANITLERYMSDCNPNHLAAQGVIPWFRLLNGDEFALNNDVNRALANREIKAVASLLTEDLSELQRIYRLRDGDDDGASTADPEVVHVVAGNTDLFVAGGVAPDWESPGEMYETFSRLLSSGVLSRSGLTQEVTVPHPG